MAENDETGKKDPADASKSAPHSDVDEAQILEEHIVAPAPRKKAPKVKPPAVPDASGIQGAAPPISAIDQSMDALDVSLGVTGDKPLTPDFKPSKASFNMSSILEEIKLPERRSDQAEKTTPQKKYDTSLVDPQNAPGTAAARANAFESAQNAARAITESLPNEHAKPQENVRAMHTLKDDLQHVVRDKKISLVRAVALEEEKRHLSTASEEYKLVQSHQQKRTHFALFFAGLLFLIGTLAIGAVLYIMSERGQTNAAPIVAHVLFSEQTVPLPITNVAPLDIRREIGNARYSASLTLGSILQIVPLLEQGVGREAVEQPISFGTFLEKIGAHAPPELARALSNEFFLGLHSVDENAPLIVIPVVSYERAFSAMLEWEKIMSSDLAPIFTLVPMQTDGSNGLPRERFFEDTILRNYDIRALKDERGTVQLFYSFPSRNILIIAESPYSFGEILSRLRADRRL